MKVYDEVKLKYEVTDLAEKGIHQGCTGDVIAVDEDKCKVLFYAPRIHGDYAVATVDINALVCKKRMNERYIE